MIWFLGKSRFSQENVIMVVPAGRSTAGAAADWQSGCCRREDATAAEEAVLLQGEIVVGVPDSFKTGRGVTTAMWPPSTECSWNT